MLKQIILEIIEKEYWKEQKVRNQSRTPPYYPYQGLTITQIFGLLAERKINGVNDHQIEDCLALLEAEQKIKQTGVAITSYTSIKATYP